jgi:DDE superfamily endonuclease
LKINYGIDITRHSVRNYLNGSGYKCYIKAKKPLLTGKHKENRKKFADKYSNYSYFDWKRMIWCDECKFSLVNRNKREFYWKRKRDPLNEENIKKTLKFRDDSIIVWGCITAEGVGELVKVNGSIDSNKYIEVLTTGLIKTMDDFSLDVRNSIFVQDNAPCHTSKMTK